MGLLLVMTAGVLRADEAEDKAVKAIEKLGGMITRDEQTDGKPVIGVVFREKNVTDADLKELAALKQLQRLYLGNCKITDKGLKELTTLKELQTLYLRGTNVTDAGVAELQKALPNVSIYR